MPIYVTSNTITRPPRGAGGTPPVENGLPPMVNLPMIQVAGLTPLYPCAPDECRSLPELACCDRLKVFGGTGLEADRNSPPGYEVDFNGWYVDLSLYAPNVAATTVAITLEKCTGQNTWTAQGNVSGGNIYGFSYALGSVSGHPNYAGCLISWARVLYLHGAGIYRIKFVSTMRSLTDCQVTEEFQLMPFDCRRAEFTVKFEAYLQGKIGDVHKQGRVFDLCGMTTNFVGGLKGAGVYDSVRLPGFFGYEKIKEYLEVMVEWQTGLQERVKDEAIQSFMFMSGYFKKDWHDRLKVYALMADTLLVSDYNINNSDYNIDKLAIVKAGNYEPVYQDKNRRRISKVVVEFKAGTQQIIKSLCCPIR